MIKIVHTSDIHLGSKFAWLGSKADEQRERVFNVFSKIVDDAIKNEADMLIISGDLFDTPFPSKQIVLKVEKEISKLINNQVHTIILPGNHDYVVDGGIYQESLHNGPYLHVFRTGEKERYDIDKLNTSVWGVGMVDKFSGKYPFEELEIELKNTKKFENNIAVVHGGVKLNTNYIGENIIDIDLVRSSKFDYIALGDWHGVLDLGMNNKAWYSGAPELHAIDQKKSGYYLFVEYSDGKVNVGKVKVGEVKSDTLVINVGELLHLEEVDIRKLENKILNKIDSLSDTSAILSVELIGERSFNLPINTDFIEETLGESFFKLVVKDNTELKFKEDELAKFPEELVLGRFVKLVKDRIAEEHDQTRIKLLKDVLQEGVRRLIYN